MATIIALLIAGGNGSWGNGSWSRSLWSRSLGAVHCGAVHCADWGEEFGPEHEVELVRCKEGILVKPLRRTPVQAALERKLMMNRPSHLDLADLDMDALGW